MKELRMPKGWTSVRSSVEEAKDKGARVSKEKKANDAIRSTKTLSYEDLEKASKKSFEEKKASDAALLKAFEEKKLKSKGLIKRAKALQKANEKRKAETA